MDSHFLYLTESQVKDLLDVGKLFDAIESALGEFSKGPSGGVIQPVRSVVKVDKSANKEDPDHPDGFLGVMPVYSSYDGTLACKIVTFYPGNARYGKDTHSAKVLLYDAQLGELLSMMDGDYITALRTAIASAVASKHVYSGGTEKPISLALIGAGIQAQSHITALSHVFKIKEVRVWSRSMERATKLCNSIEFPSKPCETVAEAVKDADIIVTATFAEKPVLKKEWVKDGAHINAIGACRADWQEMDPELMKSAVVYCDTRDACLKEAGDIILSEASIYAEIGEVINGSKQVLNQPYTVYKSVGMGLEDAVSAKLAYDTYKLSG